VDGITRSLDEHYDTLSDVEQDPCGAHKAIQDQAARIKELEEQVKDERRCLEAWFDTRELAHEAIDAAVLDAAKGYLRTSRSGGMCPQESDIIVAVIEDMARLSVFADLFARTKMPLPKQHKGGET